MYFVPVFLRFRCYHQCENIVAGFDFGQNTVCACLSFLENTSRKLQNAFAQISPPAPAENNKTTQNLLNFLDYILNVKATYQGNLPVKLNQGAPEILIDDSLQDKVSWHKSLQLQHAEMTTEMLRAFEARVNPAQMSGVLDVGSPKTPVQQRTPTLQWET